MQLLAHRSSCFKDIFNMPCLKAKKATRLDKIVTAQAIENTFGRKDGNSFCWAYKTCPPISKGHFTFIKNEFISVYTNGM